MLEKKINDSSIILCSIVRNCEKTIVAEIRTITKALNNFNNIFYYIVESDSNDTTIQKLIFCKKEFKNFKFISLGKLERKYDKRTERLAYCRNLYLKYVNEFKDINFDYVAIADLDGVNNLLTIDSINSCWKKREEWDVITANQKFKYYDIYALRHKYLQPFNHLEAIEETKTFLNLKQSEIIFHKNRLINIPSNNKLIQVESAFGGFAIYKRKVLENVKYNGLDENGKQVSEHISLHYEIIKNKYKIFINSDLINADYTIHTPKENIFRKVFGFNLIRRLKNFFKI